MIASATTKGSESADHAGKSGVGSSGAIQRRQRLGGMLNHYYRQAA